MVRLQPSLSSSLRIDNVNILFIANKKYSMLIQRDKEKTKKNQQKIENSMLIQRDKEKNQKINKKCSQTIQNDTCYSSF